MFFTGQALSTLGDSTTPVAISFAILDRGGTAAQIGWVLGVGCWVLGAGCWVLGAGTAAMVLLLLFGGTVADRWPRRRVMLVADVVRCAVQAAVAALLVAGHWHLWELVVLEALWGAGAAFFTPAMSGLLPQMLTGEILAQGNALQALSWLLGSVAGPALAGVMVATAGPGTAVAIDAGTFLVSAAMLASLCLPAVAGRTTATSMLADLRQGWVAFRSRTWLWAIVVEFSLWDLLVYAPVVVPGAVVAKAHLGGAPSWGGHMVSLRGGGAGGRPGGPAFPSSPAPGGRHRGHGRFYPPPRPARGGRPGGAHRPGGRPRRHRARPVRDVMGHHHAATGPHRGALAASAPTTGRGRSPCCRWATPSPGPWRR